jgi:hypothetical protein
MSILRGGDPASRAGKSPKVRGGSGDRRTASARFGTGWARAPAVAGLLVGSSTVWPGPESLRVLAVALAGLAGLVYLQLRETPKAAEKLVALDT